MSLLQELKRRNVIRKRESAKLRIDSPYRCQTFSRSLQDQIMLLRQTLIVLVIALLLCPGIGRAEEYRPSSYDECITDSMRGVGSDVAARAIIASCRNQFPATAPIETRKDDSVAPQAAPRSEQTAPATSRSLASGELENLKSSAFIFGGSYRVTIQNKNERVTVTEVTVAVWNVSKPDVRRNYTLPVTVPPNGTGRVTFNHVDPDPHDDPMWSDGSEEQWSIVAATGANRQDSARAAPFGDSRMPDCLAVERVRRGGGLICAISHISTCANSGVRS